MSSSPFTLSIVKFTVADIQPKHVPNPDANLLGVPVELRLQILENLLPDVDFVPFRFANEAAKALLKEAPASGRPPCSQCGQWPMPPPPPVYPWQSDSQYWTKSPSNALTTSLPDLRKDRSKCDVRIMRTCKRIYSECFGVLYTRDRMFEGAINWDYHVAQHSTLSFLSHHRIPLPKHDGNDHPLPPPMFPHESDSEEDPGDLKKALAPIGSLHLALPIYRVTTSSYQIGRLRSSLIRIVDDLVEKKQLGVTPLHRLRVELVCSQPINLPRFPSYWTESPSKAHQAQLKWILEPFARLRVSPPTEFGVQIDGEDIDSEVMRLKWAHLHRYTEFLSSSTYEEIEKTESKNLPKHLSKLVGLLKMRADIDDIHEQSSQIDEAHGDPPSPWSILPPSPPTDMMSPCGARTQIWDAWETGDWAELDRQFQAISDQWTATKDGLDPIISEVKNAFRKSGKNAA